MATGVPIPKPGKRVKQPKPLKALGKVGKARAKDRRTKLKAEPANHEGYFVCYICGGWFEQVDLEHVKDASTHPELRHDPGNHRWACRGCNLEKKRGL